MPRAPSTSPGRATWAATRAGTLRLPARPGAGAGGAVRVTADVFRGAGEIRADGGAALRGASTPGGGGGGRISIAAGDLARFTGTLSARGGGLLPGFDRSESQGGAGTVYL